MLISIILIFTIIWIRERVIQWTELGYNKWISRHVIPMRIESKFAGTEINSTTGEQKGYYRQIVSPASNIPHSYRWIIDWRRRAPSVATPRVKCTPVLHEAFALCRWRRASRAYVKTFRKSYGKSRRISTCWFRTIGRGRRWKSSR